MRVIVKKVGETPKLCDIANYDFFKQLYYMRLTDEYEIDPDCRLIALYNGSLPTSKNHNFTVHSDGSLFCGTVYIVTKLEDGSFGGLPPTAQEIAYNWLRNHCSWGKGK